MNDLELVSNDPRGWIYRLVRPGGSEVIIIYTRRNFWRGGEYHASAQHDFLIFGKLHWLRVLPMSGSEPPKFAPEALWTKYEQGTGNRRILLAPYEGHVVRADEDTLYCEWLDGQKFEKTYVPEMRIFVDRQLQEWNLKMQHGSQQQSTEKAESTSTKPTRKNGRKETTSQSQS